MSEKRFTTDYSDFIQNDKTFIKRGNERLTYKEIVDLLNEQQDQINELQSIIYDYCCETVYSLCNEIKDLKKENEQLKKEIKSKDKIIEVYYAMVELNE